MFDAQDRSLGTQALASEAGAFSVQPRIAALDGGGLLATWRVVRYGASTMNRSQRARLFDAGGVLGQSATPLEDVDEAAWRAADELISRLDDETIAKARGFLAAIQSEAQPKQAQTEPALRL